jgi:hypothetical protein
MIDNADTPITDFNDSVWGVTKLASMCSGFNAVPSKYDETNFNWEC